MMLLLGKSIELNNLSRLIKKKMKEWADVKGRGWLKKCSYFSKLFSLHSVLLVQLELGKSVMTRSVA